MRKTIIVLLGCTVVLLLGYSAYRGYELWKQNHWMTLAKEFAAQKDAKSEALSLKQVLRLDPNNVEACRMMANMAEAANLPEALTFRKKVVELDPGSLNDRLALAQTALIFQDYATARDALAGVDDAGKKTAAYYNVAGEFAAASDNPPEAEADFAEAIRIDPSDLGAQLSLAGIELSSTNTLDAAEGRITLKRIVMNSPNPAARTEAKRELTLDALRLRDNNTALTFSKELAEQTNAIFSDRLLRLDVLRMTKSDEFESALASCEREAAVEPLNMPHLTLWLMQRGRTAQALAWLQSLPMSTQTNAPAALLLAECQMVTHDWSGLQKSLSKENWGDQEFRRHAYLARALRQQGFDEASKGEWDVASNSAKDRYEKLAMLFNLAAQWNWQDEAQQTLWTIVKAFPQQQWAAQRLSQLLYVNGNTRPLMQLFNMEVSRNPANLDAKNGLALTAMLLKAQEMNPYDLSREVYQKNPTNSYYACVYAFALHLQGKNAEALKIMQSIPSQSLKNTTTDGYYGVILKAAGDHTQADNYLKRSLSGQLLPEERDLFQQTMSGR